MTYEYNGSENYDYPEFGLAADQPTNEDVHLVQQATRRDPLA